MIIGKAVIPGGVGFVIDRVYIDTPPTKTSYYEGDIFDPAGMVIKVDYTDHGVSTTGEVVSDYAYSPSGALTSSDDEITITVTMNGKSATCTQSITIVTISTTLNNNSWDLISTVSKAGTGDSYWDVGDCKAITLNGKIGDYLTLSNTTLYVFILDFNHPINKTTADNNIIWGGFKTALTGGKDVALCDSEYNIRKTSGIYFNINHNGSSSGPDYDANYGGWKGCDFRYDILGGTSTAPSRYNKSKTSSTTGYDATQDTIDTPVADTLMAALPSDLRAVLRLWNRYVDAKGNASGKDANCSTATVDALSLLADFEIFGVYNYTSNYYEQTHQKQMAYYSAGNSKIKYMHSATGTACQWWEASFCDMNSINFCLVNTGGGASSYQSRYSFGLAPAFRT